MGGGQVLCVHPEHRQIGHRVFSHQGSPQLPLVRQSHIDGKGLANHMVIGQQISVGREDNPGARGAAGTGRGRNGNHRRNVGLIDLLEAHFPLPRAPIWGLLQIHGGLFSGIGLGQGGGHLRLGLGLALDGVGHRQSVLPLMELMKQADIENAQGRGYAPEENDDHQQQCQQRSVAFGRLGRPGAVDPVVPSAVKGKPSVVHIRCSFPEILKPSLGGR